MLILVVATRTGIALQPCGHGQQLIHAPLPVEEAPSVTGRLRVDLADLTFARAIDGMTPGAELVLKVCPPRDHRTDPIERSWKRRTDGVKLIPHQAIGEPVAKVFLPITLAVLATPRPGSAAEVRSHRTYELGRPPEGRVDAGLVTRTQIRELIK